MSDGIDYPRKRNDTKVFRYVPGWSDGTPVDLTGASVRFIMMRRSAPLGDPKVDEAGTIVDDEFRYAPSAGDVDEAGDFIAEWQATLGDGTVQTWPEEGYLLVVIREDLG